MVIVSNPDLVRDIVKDTKGRFPKDNWSYSFFGPILGEGLVTAAGESWRKQNATLKPKFKHAALRQYMRAFTGAASRLRDRWAAEPDGHVVELDSTFRGVTLEVIAEVTLGLTPSDASVLPRIFSEIIDELNQRMWKPWRAWMPVEREHQARIAELDRLVLGLIRARRAEYAEAGDVPAGRKILTEEEVDAAGASLEGRADGGDFLDVMLQGGETFSEREMLDQLKTMLMAGHETTAMMLTWTTFLLTKHRGEMAKAVAEVDQAWEAAAAEGGDPSSFRWSGVERLSQEKSSDGSAQSTYLHWALHESMRLFAPVPILAKCTARDNETLGDAVLPAGTKVMICCVALNKDPKLWGDDVADFRPERHASDEVARTLGKQYRFAFLPFSIGRRECIGRRLALVEAKTFLAYILRDFDLRLAPGQTDSPTTDCYMIPLRPEGGMRVTVRRRKRGE